MTRLLFRHVCQHLSAVAVAAAAAFLYSGCSRVVDTEQPRIGRVQSECVRAAHESVMTQGGTFSLEFSSGVLWVFGETFLERPNGEGDGIISSSAAWTAAGSDPCSAPWQYLADSTGALAPLIRFTPAERAYNDTSTQGVYRLWPTGGFVAGDTGYIYYEKVQMRDYFDLDVLGTGLAAVTDGGDFRRVLPQIPGKPPDLLWTEAQSGWGRCALLNADGFVYLYRGVPRDAFGWATQIARVSPADAANPDAYEYWDGWGWTHSIERTAVIIEDAREASVAFNSCLGRYLAVYVPPFSNAVTVRSAPHPWGPWDMPLELFTGHPPHQWFIQSVRQHPHLSAGREIVVSYYSDYAAPDAGLYFVNVEFGELR